MQKMVHFFTSSEGYVIYMGADKFENEDLIRYGLPEDLWFHVDNLSSAHVYLRMRKGQRLEELSPKAIQECAQLVKANSIEGCKLKSVNVGRSFTFIGFSHSFIPNCRTTNRSLYSVEKFEKNGRYGNWCYWLSRSVSS